MFLKQKVLYSKGDIAAVVMAHAIKRIHFHKIGVYRWQKEFLTDSSILDGKSGFSAEF